MEMELMENGLPAEEQTMQPDAVPELEPGSDPDVPEPVEAETPEEPPKRKRVARMKENGEGGGRSGPGSWGYPGGQRGPARTGGCAPGRWPPG